MKRMKAVLFMAIALTGSLIACGQNNGGKASPAVTVKETLSSGTELTINYGQPSVKGRTIGKDLEPMEGKIWRAGANEATTFEINKDVRVQGQPLPAGKYAFFLIEDENEWTLIFNKEHKQWGAYNYKQSEDALRVKAKKGKASPASEKLTYSIAKDGKVTILWGDRKVEFKVD